MATTFRLVFDDGTIEEISTSRLPAAGMVAMERKYGRETTTEAVLYGKWWGKAKVEQQAIDARGPFEDWLSSIDIEVLVDQEDKPGPSSGAPPES